MFKIFNYSSVLSKTIIVTIGTFIGSVFSYLLQIFLGRLLTIEDFGAFTALLSLSLIIGVFVSTFETSLVKMVASLYAKERFEVLTKLFKKLSIILLLLGLLFFSIITLAKGMLGSYLSIHDEDLFVFFGIYFGISFLYMLPTAFLQGLQRFRSYSAFVVVSLFLRFLFPVLAVVLGYGLRGVFIGISLSIFVSFVVGTLVLNRNFTLASEDNLTPYFKDILTFATSVLFVRIGMTLLNNMDVILAKHYFDQNLAGIYAGVVTVGKVLLFGASTVAVVMFPMISSAYNKGEPYMSKFRQFLFIQLLVVGLGVFLFTLFPKLIITIMFGQAYLPSAEFLPLFSLFMGSYVLINFFILFLLAIEKIKVYFLLIPAVIIQLLLISRFHDSIVEVVVANLTVSASLLFGVILFFIKNVGINNNSRL